MKILRGESQATQDGPYMYRDGQLSGFAVVKLLSGRKVEFTHPTALLLAHSVIFQTSLKLPHLPLNKA